MVAVAHRRLGPQLVGDDLDGRAGAAVLGGPAPLLEGLRIHDLRHTAVALWIAAGANPKEVAARAGHASVSFTLDRYGHLYPEADTALRDRLDAIYGSAQPAPAGTVIRLSQRPGRGPSVAPGGSGNDESAADGGSATL